MKVCNHICVVDKQIWNSIESIPTDKLKYDAGYIIGTTNISFVCVILLSIQLRMLSYVAHTYILAMHVRTCILL